MRLERIALALALSTLLLTATASAGTYYVATTGNDTTGTGTITNPFASIYTAVRNGTVYSDLTAGNPVTIYGDLLQPHQRLDQRHRQWAAHHSELSRRIPDPRR